MGALSRQNSTGSTASSSHSVSGRKRKLSKSGHLLQRASHYARTGEMTESEKALAKDIVIHGDQDVHAAMHAAEQEQGVVGLRGFLESHSQRGSTGSGKSDGSGGGQQVRFSVSNVGYPRVACGHWLICVLLICRWFLF